MTVHAEISIVPIAEGCDTSMSNEVAAAFDAIRKIKNIKTKARTLHEKVKSVRRKLKK